ncbi:hypothetical protein G7046_g7491 [Stylonectria norvegica]|nr:hypothetical protein G7046_g7491 [Stylonectria norvegica]
MPYQAFTSLYRDILGNVITFENRGPTIARAARPGSYLWLAILLGYSVFVITAANSEPAKDPANFYLPDSPTPILSVRNLRTRHRKSRLVHHRQPRLIATPPKLASLISAVITHCRQLISQPRPAVCALKRDTVVHFATMSSRKRSRSIVPEENRAECPFTIQYPNKPTRAEQDRPKKKKQKRESPPDEEKKVQFQNSPFSPVGRFKTYDNMDLHYSVDPRKRWFDMTRYNSFVLNGTKYYSEGFVFVANESTIEQQKAQPSLGQMTPRRKSNDDWVARILEIRAADEHHVYARVYWMYWPDELPADTIDGRKKVQGRQPYHGFNELIASNHMDVINVVSVTMPALVSEWVEADDEEIHDSLYWRQAWDCRSHELSSVDLMCKCQTPANPDKTLIGCTNSECGKWMHSECLEHDVLLKVFNRLGTDKRHVLEPAGKGDKKEDGMTRPLSPTEAKEQETQPTIDVRLSAAQGSDKESSHQAETATPKGQMKVPESTIKSASAKKGRKKKDVEYKPYVGLFEASLKMTDGPTAWEITDLRKKLPVGVMTWMEPAQCLLCGVAID